MKRLFLIPALALFAAAVCAETITNVSFFAAPGNTWQTSAAQEVKTPDGSPAFALKITASAPEAKAWHKQANFTWANAAEKGRKYRLTFHYKGSAPGKVIYHAARATAPYSAIPGSGRELAVTAEWQKEVREFTIREFFPAPLAMPRFQAGLYPAGETLYLGPVTLERLDETYASLLTPEWQCAKGESLPVDRIPAGTRSVRLENDTFDLGKAKESSAAVFYQEFDAPADGVMTLGMAADWRFECFVNGKLEYNTLKGGNAVHKFTPEDHVFNVPVRKGKNLVAVRVLAGSQGWRFVCGKVPPSANPELARLFKVEAGEAFRPVDADRFLEIKPGTALDFSDFVPREPAGTHGRVIVSPEGKPVFEKKPGEPVRFYSFNFMLLDMWRQRYHEWDHSAIDRFADAVMRRGYNQVRIHLPESFLIGYKLVTTSWRQNTIADTLLPQTVAELEQTIDMGNLDRLDYLFAAFKKRGIYVNLDLAGNKMITRAFAREKPGDGFKARLFFDAKFRNHWKLFTEYLMRRVNPYTQIAYKDDPVIMQINFINEQDLRFAAGLEYLTPLFRDWLRARYRSDAELAKAWGAPVTFGSVPDITEADLRPGDRRAEDIGTFLIETIREMTTWFYTTLRSAGYPGLVNHWDMIMRTLELPGRALLPCVAQHTYFAHPSGLPPRKLIEKSRTNSTVNNFHFDCFVGQGSSLDSSYFRAAAAARFLDRPYFITEFSHCGPNRYRHERGLYFSSYAALQDWDALTSHDTTVKLKIDPFLWFDNALDPISRANEALGMLIYLRRDVQAAPHSVALELKSKEMFPKHYLSAIGDDYAKLSLVTRLGLLYPEIKPLEPVGKASPDLTLTALDFVYLPVSQWYVSPDNFGGGKAEGLFRQLRQKGILPAGNPSDPGKGLYVSETGELTLRAAEKTMTVVTPRLEGAILKKNAPVKLDALEIFACDKPASIAAASLEREKSLRDAGRILLVITTNAFNSGQIFNTEELSICYESGNTPALIEAVKLELALSTNRREAPEAYALHFDGTRAESIPVSVENDRMLLRLDSSKLKFGAIFYEIIL